MTKERMKDLLIIAMLPFLVVVWETTDWSFLRPIEFEERKCDTYHDNAHPSLRCEIWEP